ncbi:MAG: GTPase HflX [Ruminococcaceae bacterium]|nr:GTPase HflX [Oscillospiraceae bacterium]
MAFFEQHDILDHMKGVPSAVLVGVSTRDVSTEEAERGLDELERLLDTAGGVVFARVMQSRPTLDPATVIGSGKVEEIASLCKENEIELVIFDMELSPAQIRNLEDGIGKDVRVIDRSMLILDIFALHATTMEGKVQVELAQLKYTAPRLSGHGTEMSRLGGGIGTRGPGESQLESDRRHMQRRIRALEDQLEEMNKNRRTMRATRQRSGIPTVALVGYTNAGKSTLLNRLTDAGILAENKLFATLDPTTRQYTLPSGDKILLTDTVGFIRKLPHHLIRAFRSTLDEAALSDILLIMIDASDPECREQLECTEALLEELGAADKPKLYVFNQCDKPEAQTAFPLPGKSAGQAEAVFISAKTGQGLDELLTKLTALIHGGRTRATFVIPNAKQGMLSKLYAGGASIEEIDYGAEAVTVTAVVDAATRGALRDFDTCPQRAREEWED